MEILRLSSQVTNSLELISPVTVKIRERSLVTVFQWIVSKVRSHLRITSKLP